MNLEILEEYENGIPSRFLQLNGWKPSESEKAIEETIEEGTILRCIPAELFTPDIFYVNTYSQWDELAEFQERLNKDIFTYMDESYEVNQICGAKMEYLKPGLFVLVKYKGSKCIKLEWHRAIVLENPLLSDAQKNPKNKFHSLDPSKGSFNIVVRLIDFGTYFITNVEHIRYMPEKYMNWLQPQAIQCQLAFHLSIVNDWRQLTQGIGYSQVKCAVNEFHKQLDRKLIAVTFIRRVKIPLASDGENQRWIVNVDILEDQQCFSAPEKLTKNQRRKIRQRQVEQMMFDAKNGVNFVRDIQTSDKTISSTSFTSSTDRTEQIDTGKASVQTPKASLSFEQILLHQDPTKRIGGLNLIIQRLIYSMLLNTQLE